MKPVFDLPVNFSQNLPNKCQKRSFLFQLFTKANVEHSTVFFPKLMFTICSLALLPLSLTLAHASPQTMPSYSAANSELVNKGAYIARQADCMSCHKEDYSGGVAVETPMGKIYGTNITPSIEYGIGRYTEQDLKNALKHGKAPNHRLYPAMPYPAYSGMTDEDIHALFEYLQTVEPVDTPPENKTNLPFPFNIRSLMIGWNLINMPNWQPREGLDDSQQHGQYLVDNLAHCGTCHTPRNATMGYDMSKYLSGAVVGDAFAPNITPDDDSGIGTWTTDEIVTYLKHGEIHKKAVATGPMGEVVSYSTQYLTNEDLSDIANYLKAIPSIQTDDIVHPVNTAALSREHSDDIGINLLEQIDVLDKAKSQANETGERLYLEQCASCHGVNGYGQPDAGYASIVGISSLRRDNPDAIVNVIARGVHDVLNTRPQMPGFTEDLTADEIAQVSNYVRVKFGGLERSDVGAETVNSILNTETDKPWLIKYAGVLFVLGIFVALALLFFFIRWLLRKN